MCREKTIFIVAGSLIGTGVLLGVLVSPWWLILPAFVSVNMLQAGLTGFCPLSKILVAAGVEPCTTGSPTS